MARVDLIGPAARIIQKLKRAKEGYEKGTERGIVKAALLLQRASQIVVPVDTGLLRSTARTRKTGSGFNTQANVSYGTHYALFVHEDLEARHAPGTFAKYLEGPARLLQNEFKRIIRTEAEKGRREVVL